MNKRLATCLELRATGYIGKDAMNRGVVHYFRHSDRFKQMLDAQNHSCAICGNTCNTGRELAVDHCHKSGAIRGLLCGKCNKALGLVNDDVAILKTMIEYLERWE